MNDPSTRGRWAAAAVAVLAALPGCNTLISDWVPGGFTVPAERLRQVERLRLEAETADANAPAPGPTTQPAGPPPERLRLTLEQCRALALAGNLDLKVQLLNPAIAAQSVTEAEAQFEALLATDVSWSKTDTPTSSDLSGSSVESAVVTPSLRARVPTGGDVSVDLPASRLATDNRFSTLDPSYTADLRFGFRQPLLRGAGFYTNTHALRVARWEVTRSEALAKLEVIRVLAAADRLYWRLYAVRREQEVRRQERALAEAQLARARRQVDAGDKPEVEIVRAQLGVAERKEALIVAANEVRRSERDLKRILQKPGLPLGSRTTLLPGTQPAVVPYRLDVGRLVELAKANRMELLALELQLAQDASTIDFEQNAALPLVSVGYTYNINGLGPTRDDAFDLLFEKRFEDHSLGVQVEVPLGNAAARSRLRRAILQRRQRLASRRQREVLVEQEVRDAVDQVQANWQRILASRQRVTLAERVLAAEQRQFDQGLRTSTEVLEAQASLADARSAELRALVEYQVAQVDLAVATGTLLGAAKVRWEPAGRDAN